MMPSRSSRSLIHWLPNLRVAIFVPAFFATSLSFVLYTAGVGTLQFQQIKAISLENTSTIQRLFGQTISVELKSGIYKSVYRKCLQLFDHEKIVGLQVRGADGDIVCDLKKDRPSVFTERSETKILASPDADPNIPALGVVTIEFSLDSIIFGALKSLLILLGGIGLTIAAAYFVIRRVSSEISAPIEHICKLLKSGDFQRLVGVSVGADPSGIGEIRELEAGLEELGKTLVRFREETVREERDKSMVAAAAQISHDIRSPLATLLSIIQVAHGMDESSRTQLRQAVNRIRDIANGLLAKNRVFASTDERSEQVQGTLTSEEIRSVEFIPALVETAVSQKRLQFRDRSNLRIELSLSAKAYGVFSVVQPTELHRIISNLVNNAIEACEGEARIEVGLGVNSNCFVLSVCDNGRGIPSELLAKVTERGGTFGKKNGNGLGLSHAKMTVESWGGKLTIESVVGRGTTIRLEIPLAGSPPWFAECIRLEDEATVIVVDDDPGIHGLWEGRFRGLPSPPVLLHFSSPKELLAWYRETLAAVDNPVYLFDYELGASQTGLDLIEMIGVGSSAILVTSRWDEESVRSRCEKSGVRLLPKSLAPFIPIHE